MERNRYFKYTLGVGGEVVIAASLDTSGVPVDGIKATGATTTVTVAASPAVGDRINFVVNNVPISYIVAAGDTTAATLVANIVIFLNSFGQNWTASVTGTTSAVFTFTPNATGTQLNSATNTITLGAPNVSTFSASSSTNFGSNGTATVGAGVSADFKTFIANAAAGALGVYWDDTNIGDAGAGLSGSNKSVTPGSTTLSANINRSYFYAYKDAAGNTLRTSPIPVAGRKVAVTRYNAATADIFTITYTGTHTAGQYIWVRIADITSAQVPYPNWEYFVISSGTINTDVAALAVLINAEPNAKPVTAGASTNVLTLTGVANNQTIKVSAYLEIAGIYNSGSAINTDASIMTVAQTQFRTTENGTVADVKELEKYLKIRNGVMVYVNEGYTPDEFNLFNSNIVAGGQYGLLSVKSFRGNYGGSQSTVDPVSGNPQYTLVAVPDTLILALAAY